MADSMRSRSSRVGATLVSSALIVAVVALDQVTKWLVAGALAGEEGDSRVELLWPWLALDYVENRGAAFGLFQGSSNLMLVLAVLVVLGIAVTFHRLGGVSPLMPVATCLILGGAIGNIVDRVRLGFVIDFVAVGPWPKFNVADAAISVGVGLMVIAMLFGSDSAPRPSHRAGEIGASQ